VIRGLSAHLNTLYADVPEAERCTQAAEDGFSCVEMWAPPPVEIRDDVRASVESLGLRVASVNTQQGRKSDDFGLAGEPTEMGWWRADFLATLSFARYVNSGAINVLVGGRRPAATEAAQLNCLLTNLDWAVSQLDRDDDPLLLLEPLNRADRESPLLHRVEDALAVMARLGNPPSLQLLFDAYHLYQEEERLVGALHLASPRIGHVQLADYPGRAEPGTGEIPFALFLAELAQAGYDGWLGLEYFPRSTRSERFAWISEHRELQQPSMRSVQS
jgi:hydroxypyruvate isomerase